MDTSFESEFYSNRTCDFCGHNILIYITKLTNMRTQFRNTFFTLRHVLSIFMHINTSVHAYTHTCDENHYFM
jgi:hypothetical protein